MPRSPRQDTIAKLHRTIGETVKRPVGADDPVRPWGNGKFAATYCKNGRAACGSMRRPQASFEAQPRAARLLAPKMGIAPYKRGAGSHWYIQFCGCVLPGGQGRPPLRVHTISHWCTPICRAVPHNPSVTASPCHLPLHKGGFGWCKRGGAVKTCDNGRGKPLPHVTTKRGGIFTLCPKCARMAAVWGRLYDRASVCVGFGRGGDIGGLRAVCGKNGGEL